MERHHERRESVPAEKHTWTIAVDLSTDIADGGLNYRKSQQLKSLAAETKHSGVSYVVQTPARDGYGGHTDLLRRYAVSDGKVTPLPEVKSVSMDADLGNLISETQKLYPARHNAVILTSHGNGARGVETEYNTKMTLDSLKETIAKNSKNKLDTLVFDSCQMSVTNVSQKLASVTRSIVSSEDLVYTNPSTGADFLNEGAAIEKLIHNPKMSGPQFAKAYVELAASGAEAPGGATGDGAGASNLEAIQIGRIQQLTGALNNFGTQLANALGDSSNRQAIESAIATASTANLNRFYPDNLQMYMRDLGDFAKEIDSAIKTGRISDKSGSLSFAATAIEGELHATVIHWGEKNSRYESQSGLATFLPDSSLTGVSAEVKRSDVFDTFLSTVDKSVASAIHSSDEITSLKNSIDDIESNAAAYLADKYYLLPCEAGCNKKYVFMYGTGKDKQPLYEAYPEFSRLRADGDALETAKTDSEVNRALESVRIDAQAIQALPLHKSLLEDIRARMQAPLKARLAEAELPENTGWNAFLDRLEH